MAKVIFLDIDGVLNIYSPAYCTSRFSSDGSIKHIEEHLVARLMWIMEQTDAVICISSSWRGNMDDLQEQMEKSGFTKWDRVVGKTPRLHNRGDEIAAWMANRTDIEKYIVLEDEPIDVCGEKCNAIPDWFVVKVDMKEGLTFANAEEAVIKLGRIYGDTE